MAGGVVQYGELGIKHPCRMSAQASSQVGDSARWIPRRHDHSERRGDRGVAPMQARWILALVRVPWRTAACSINESACAVSMPPCRIAAGKCLRDGRDAKSGQPS